MELVLATHNPGKVREVKDLLPGFIRLHTLESLGFNEQIPETGQTLQENALLKARTIRERFGLPCIADDTGLLVEALDNAPGVYSARYAGTNADAAANIDKLLDEMKDIANRKARFETIIALAGTEGDHLFKGVVEGVINRQPSGTGGFGYDPVFLPLGSDKTFAELSMTEKNRISHRSRALAKLMGFLTGHYKESGYF